MVGAWVSESPGGGELPIYEDCLHCHNVCKNKSSSYQVIEMSVLIYYSSWHCPKMGAVELATPCAHGTFALTYLKVFSKDMYQLYIV